MSNIILEEIYKKLSKPIQFNEWKKIYDYYCQLIKINTDQSLISQETLKKLGLCLLDAVVITNSKTNVDHMMAQMQINNNLKR